MPAWADPLSEFQAQPDDKKGEWLLINQTHALQSISKLRQDKNVLLYASAFLQKPQAPAPKTQITYEDINGIMSTLYGMQWNKGLCLVLHTPGGVTNAAESIVAYLRSKFTDLEVIVPAPGRAACRAFRAIRSSADLIVTAVMAWLPPRLRRNREGWP